MMKPDKILYQTEARATGGREGAAKTPDGVLDVKLSTPKELGGPGGSGTNPEQLFAAGYSACFLGAVKLVAGKQKVKIGEDASITGHVGIGPVTGGLALAVELKITLPGVDKATAEDIVEKAHHVCPYSNATRNNVDVKLTVV